MTAPALREDILVSVCISSLTATPETFAAVRALAASLDRRFRFREILLVADMDDHEAYLPLVQSTPNLRLLALKPGYGYYDRRVIAADEAIGDVVVITPVEELGAFDLTAMIERAAARNCALMGVRPATRPLRRGLWAPVVVLGRSAGFKIGPRDMQTLVLTRTLLNQLLARSNPELSLRFPPRDARFPLFFVEMDPKAKEPSLPRRFPSRLRLMQKLLAHMAPQLLFLVSISSSLLALSGILLVFYIIGAWIVVETLAPGWLTTMGMLSLTATFLGVSILGLSLGLQQLLSNVQKDSLGEVAIEINRIDLFGQVASDLNVDIETDGIDSGRNARA